MRMLAALMIFLVFPPAAFCAEPVSIHLSDGSVLMGVVVSVERGVYVVETRSLGTLRIPAKQVARVTPSERVGAAWNSYQGSPGPGAGSFASAPVRTSPEALTKRILADGKSMEIIQGLADDPDVAEVLADPGLMEAVRSGDVQALARDPRFLKLLENPGVREIGERMGH